MRALVYHRPGHKNWEEVPDPIVEAATDAVVRVDTITICGTDLHILKCTPPRSPTAVSSATRPSGPLHPALRNVRRHGP
jgi:threonine dehydrogenase-like Zn-dependent dehydrogenase